MTRTITTDWQRGRRTIHAGDEIRVKRLGHVRFRQHVQLDDGREWIDVVHPTYGFHSVRPDRVVCVPRNRKLRPVGVAA